MVSEIGYASLVGYVIVASALANAVLFIGRDSSLVGIGVKAAGARAAEVAVVGRASIVFQIIVSFYLIIFGDGGHGSGGSF